MQTKNRVEIVVQNNGEGCTAFSDRLNGILASINKDYPNCNLFMLPTADTTGRQTVFIQWQWHERKEYDNVMILGLAGDITKRLSGITDPEEVKRIISEKVHEFVKD